MTSTEAPIVAVVTGAARGIGRAIGLRLASDGYAVGLTDVSPQVLTVAEEIRGLGMLATGVVADITDTAAVATARQQIHAELGTPSVLVNNAGWNEIRRFTDTDPDFWQRIVATNYLGMLGVTQAFLPDLLDAGARGRIVNVSSDSGRVGSSGESVYSGAKGAVIAFSKALARELARASITVNCVCPGPTDTPLLQSAPEDLVKALIRAVPFRRLATPDDVANAVSFFAQEASGYVTGQTLSVSGGLSMAG